MGIFGHFEVLGIFFFFHFEVIGTLWSFFIFCGYLGHFRGFKFFAHSRRFEGILVILAILGCILIIKMFWGILVILEFFFLLILEDLRAFWSFLRFWGHS